MADPCHTNALADNRETSQWFDRLNHFINTAASDPSRSRTVGLTQLTPEPFPVLFVGNNGTHQFFFGNRGTIESFSGDAAYTLRVTIGNAFATATGGTWTLQVGSGTTYTLPWDIDAGGLQTVLNADATVIAEGYVDVVQTGSGRFLVAYRTLGVATGFTVDGHLLQPDCSAELSVLTTGSASVRQLMTVSLRRTVPLQTTSWTPITSPYNGWTGTLAVNSAAAFELLRLNGVVRGDIIECTTLLNVEVVNGAGSSTAYYQTPVTLRAINYAVAAETQTVSTMTQNFFVRPNVTGLASNVVSAVKLGGLQTSANQFPVGSTVQCLFTNDVVALFIRKSSTANQSVPFTVRPYDYDASVNAYQWILDRVTKQGVPSTWDADSNAFHYVVAVGNANAVALSVDQTGFTLPA